MHTEHTNALLPPQPLQCLLSAQLSVLLGAHLSVCYFRLSSPDLAASSWSIIYKSITLTLTRVPTLSLTDDEADNTSKKNLADKDAKNAKDASRIANA